MAPAAIVAKLNEHFVKAARGPDIARLMAPQAAGIVFGTPEAFARLIAGDVEHLGKIVREAGIKAQ